ITAPPPPPHAPPISPRRSASPPSSDPSVKGHRMTMRAALPMLALTLPVSLLGACASSPKPQPIPAVAEQRQCPAYPLPPADLLKPPAKTDFLNPTPSSPPNKPSSSTN